MSRSQGAMTTAGPMDRSDNELILAHRKGDATAFPVLVRRHADSLLSYHMRMTHDRQLAEDLFQETFRKVHERVDTFQARGRFTSWLFSIAYTTAIDSLRKSARRPKMVSGDRPEVGTESEGEWPPSAEIRPGSDGNSPAKAAILAENRAQVHHALEQLPPQQRATVVLVYYKGLAYNQVADVLGCSVGTVKTHMFRALRKLAQFLVDAEEI